jgi:MFS family permease
MLADALRRFRGLHRNARLYLISNTMQAVTAGGAGVLYTLYLTALGYHTDFIGAVVVIGAIGAALGILPASPLVARFGWRAMLLWSDWIGGIAIAAQLLFPTPPVIVITTLGLGASVAIFLVINTPLLAHYSTAAERTSLFALNNALLFLAAVVGSLLGGLLPGWLAQPAIAQSAVLHTLAPFLVADPKARSYQLAMLVLGALAVPSIIPVLAMSKDGVAGPAGPAGHTDATRTMPSSMVEWVRRGVAQARAVGQGVIGRFSVTQSLVGFGAGIFFPYVNLYVVNQLHGTTAFFGTLSAAYTVLLAVASLVSAPLADRYGKVRLSVAAYLCSLPFLLVQGAVPLLWVVSAAFLLRGFLANLTNVPLQAYLMEAVPERSRVVASGVYNVSFQVAGAAGAGVGGLLIAYAGNQASFFAAAPFYLASALLLALWFGRGRIYSTMTIDGRRPGHSGQTMLPDDRAS